jgi:integrase
VLAKGVNRANGRLGDTGEVPLPAGLTPHSLRRTFASLLYAIGEPAPVVMQELGHTHPALALRIYAAAMRRDDDENGRLRALIEGGLGTSANSDSGEAVNAVDDLLSESRS